MKYNLKNRLTCIMTCIIFICLDTLKLLYNREYMIFLFHYCISAMKYFLFILAKHLSKSRIWKFTLTATHSNVINLNNYFYLVIMFILKIFPSYVEFNITSCILVISIINFIINVFHNNSKVVHFPYFIYYKLKNI